jgi:hypothetical protein
VQDVLQTRDTLKTWVNEWNRDIFIALSPSLVCKSGSDGSVASTTASSVSQTHAYTEAI